MTQVKHLVLPYILYYYTMDKSVGKMSNTYTVNIRICRVAPDIRPFLYPVSGRICGQKSGIRPDMLPVSSCI